MELAIILLLAFLGLALVVGVLILVVIIVLYYFKSQSQNIKKDGGEPTRQEINYGSYKQESPKQLEQKQRAIQRAQEGRSTFQMKLMPLPVHSDSDSQKTIKLLSEKQIPFPFFQEKISLEKGNNITVKGEEKL